MNRAEKKATIERMNEAFARSPHVLLAAFSGLSVNDATLLRRRVREAGGSYRVVKNRLAKRAAVGTAAEPLAEQFAGPCAIALHEDDPVGLAKALADFVKDHPALQLKGGVVDAKDVVDAEGVKRLAEMPGLPELRAQLLSLFVNPATSLVRLLGTPGTQLARVMDARREAMPESGEAAPAAADAAAESAAPPATEDAATAANAATAATDEGKTEESSEAESDAKSNE